MGLHNHDRHFYSPGYGDRCGKCWYCSPETPCYCCLQAEVEALRARNETLIATIQRQDSTFERQMEEHEELEALRAQVLAVRELHAAKDCGCCCAECPDGWPCNTIRILDGGDA